MEVIKKYIPLYKLDTKGKTRVWYMELGQNGEEYGYRTVAGIKDGKMVTSEWRLSSGKNLGRSNETTPREQAESEIKSNYTSKQDSGYFGDQTMIKNFDKFMPMLANDYSKLKKGLEFPVISQPKLDGIRCLSRANGLWTRAGKEITSCPHLEESLKEVFDAMPGIIIDGELYNHELKDDFNSITSMVRKTKLTEADITKSKELVQYHVYDLFDTNNPNMPFTDRQQLLSEIVKDIEGVVVVETTKVFSQEKLDELYGTYLTDGFEGQMVRIDSAYENKRSKFLLKRKEFITDEFTVVSVEEGQGNWSGHIKRFVLNLPDGTQFGAGVRGNQATLRELFESNNKPTWATLRYFTPTPDGIPRFPVVVDWGVGERND